MEKAIMVLLFLQDGSSIHGELKTKDIVCHTQYGKLIVPAGKVQFIDYGLHYPEGMREKVADLVKNLGSPKYKEREFSTKELVELGRYGYNEVSKGAESTDQLELKKRCEQILPKIEPYKQSEGDRINLVDGWAAVGTIDVSPIVIKNETLGDLKFFPHMLRKAIFNVSSAKEIKVEPNSDWVDTDIDTSIFRTKITANGIVDLWAQQPGQTTCGPNGYTQPGSGSGHPAGALIGKIGNGQEFVVGSESYIPKQGGAGKGNRNLYLRIVPSPWAGANYSGQYDVMIQKTAD